MSLKKNLFNVIVCPKCKRNISKKNMFFICKFCKLAFPILENNIPDMLIEESWKLEKAKKANFKHDIRM